MAFDHTVTIGRRAEREGGRGGLATEEPGRGASIAESQPLVGSGTGCAVWLAAESRSGTPRCRPRLHRRQILKKPDSLVRRVRLPDLKSSLVFREVRFR